MQQSFRKKPRLQQVQPNIFRKAVSEFLPQETNERKKLGFPIPIRVWLRQNDWYQMVTDLFTSKEAEEFFHTEKLLQLLNDHKDKKADNRAEETPSNQ